ncbi:GHMP family kinase ATP-binding protein, partial [Nocardia pseudobrasiliensis]
MSAGVTATAHPNIALIKYWGKRDERLRLPVTSSLSLTLDVFPTVTTVAVDDDLAADTVTVGEASASDTFAAKVIEFLGLVRDLAGDRRAARVRTVNHGPTGAGLASSASGFAALAVAAARAYGLELDGR